MQAKLKKKTIVLSKLNKKEGLVKNKIKSNLKKNKL